MSANARPRCAARDSPPTPAAPPAQPKVDELADLRHTNQQMAEDIRRLRSSLDTLRASVHEDKTPAQLRVLQANLDNVQSGLTATAHETNTAVAQLNGKLEKIEHDPTKVQQLAERLGKLEKGNVDLTSTGSISPAGAAKLASVPTPPVKPGSPKLAGDEAHKGSADPMKPDFAAAKGPPQVIAGYVVRDVYDGVALIEGRHGLMEVVPGVSIPGAGHREIDRPARQRAGRWRPPRASSPIPRRRGTTAARATPIITARTSRASNRRLKPGDMFSPACRNPSGRTRVYVEQNSQVTPILPLSPIMSVRSCGVNRRSIAPMRSREQRQASCTACGSKTLTPRS